MQKLTIFFIDDLPCLWKVFQDDHFLFFVEYVKSFVHYQMNVWQIYIQYVLSNSPPVVWVVDLDYYRYWTIKFRTKINKLMVQYINITRGDYILSVPHEVSKSETKKVPKYSLLCVHVSFLCLGICDIP